MDGWLYGLYHDDYYFPAYGEGTWTYIDGYVVEISDEDSEELAMDDEAILSGLGNPVVAGEISSETYAQMAETVLVNINNYTAEHYGYINGFTVSVEPVTSIGAQTVTIKITKDMNNAWYKSIGDSVTTTVTNDDGTTTDVLLDIAYEAGATAVVAGKTFVAPNSTVTISLDSTYASDYDLVSFDGNMAADNFVTYKFGKDFTADFVQKSATVQEHIPAYVSFYSEVPVEYLYNGENVVETLTGSDNIYLIPDYAVGGTLPAIATSAENHYFLGWADRDVNDNYQFVASATVDAFYEEGASELTTPDYYAIWAYNESQKLTSTYSVASDTADLPGVGVIKAAEGSVYSWYTNKDFTGNAITTLADLNGSTIVYARLQFDFTFTVNYNGGTTMSYEGNGNYSPANNSLTYTVTVYEGNKVEVSYKYTEESGGSWIFSYARYTAVVDISICESDSNSSIISTHTLRVQSSNGNSGSWDRRLVNAEQESAWVHSVNTVAHDGARITDGSDTMSDVVGKIGLTYSV